MLWARIKSEQNLNFTFGLFANITRWKLAVWSHSLTPQQDETIQFNSWDQSYFLANLNCCKVYPEKIATKTCSFTCSLVYLKRSITRYRLLVWLAHLTAFACFPSSWKLFDVSFPTLLKPLCNVPSQSSFVNLLSLLVSPSFRCGEIRSNLLHGVVVVLVVANLPQGQTC